MRKSINREITFDSFDGLIKNFEDWTFLERKLLYRGKKGVLWTLYFEDREKNNHSITTRVSSGVFTVKEVNWEEKQ